MHHQRGAEQGRDQIEQGNHAGQRDQVAAHPDRAAVATAQAVERSSSPNAGAPPARNIPAPAASHWRQGPAISPKPGKADIEGQQHQIDAQHQRRELQAGAQGAGRRTRARAGCPDNRALRYGRRVWSRNRRGEQRRHRRPQHQAAEHEQQRRQQFEGVVDQRDCPAPAGATGHIRRAPEAAANSSSVSSSALTSDARQRRDRKSAAQRAADACEHRIRPVMALAYSAIGSGHAAKIRCRRLGQCDHGRDRRGG